MRMARAHLVDRAVTRWYHCIARCWRRNFLLSEGTFDRKEWIKNRLQEPVKFSDVAVGGLSVMEPSWGSDHPGGQTKFQV